MLARLSRFHQSRDHATVLSGSIQDLFDRNHIRISRRFLDQLHHRFKALIRMMHEDVSPLDRIKETLAWLDLR